MFTFAARRLAFGGLLGVRRARKPLGWTHGFGWIGLCLLVYVRGCMRKVFPWPLLAATAAAALIGGVLGRESSPWLGAPARERERRVFPLNLPNVLTLLRILLVPALVVALMDESPGDSPLAAGVFAVAALTDGLDGYLARSRQAVTKFGKVMDPIADKLMIAAALMALVSLDRVAGWVAMVIIAREFAVSGLRSPPGSRAW